LELIGNSPFIYKETEFDPNIRQGLIKKLSSIFYEVKPDRIEVLSFETIARTNVLLIFLFEIT